MVNISNAKEWVSAIILLIILGAIGVLIQTELYGSMKDTSTTYNGTTTGLTAGTPYRLVIGSLDFPADLSVTFVTNETEGSHYEQNDTQWFINSTLGEITILDTIIASDPTGSAGVEDVDNTNFNITYSYVTGATKTDVLKNGTLAIGNLTKQLPTVGIIMGVLLIIGAVVMMSVYFGRKGGYM